VNTSPATTDHRTRRRALWRTWANSAVRQSREAKRAGEPAIEQAFLRVAELAADAAIAAIRAGR
jgi:hypothetical protein